jgi:hypothetical protein
VTTILTQGDSEFWFARLTEGRCGMSVDSEITGSIAEASGWTGWSEDAAAELGH